MGNPSIASDCRCSDSPSHSTRTVDISPHTSRAIRVLPH